MALIGVRRTLLHKKTAAALTPPVVSFVNFATSPSGSGTTTRTYTAAPIGTAFATRRIIIAAESATTGRTLTGCTIGTISAASTIAQTTNANGNLIAFASAVVPTGTTGDIVLTFSSTEFTNARVHIWSVDDSLLISPVPTLGFNESGASVTTNTASVTASANGFLLLVNYFAAAVTAQTISSSTATITVDDTNGRYIAGHSNGLVAGSSSATLTWSTATQSMLAMAAFR